MENPFRRAVIFPNNMQRDQFIRELKNRAPANNIEREFGRHLVTVERACLGDLRGLHHTLEVAVENADMILSQYLTTNIDFATMTGTVFEDPLWLEMNSAQKSHTNTLVNRFKTWFGMSFIRFMNIWRRTPTKTTPSIEARHRG